MNALSHAYANAVLVRSGKSATPQKALENFQERETHYDLFWGFGVAATAGLAPDMDRENNIAGNLLGQQQDRRVKVGLKTLLLTWIENGTLVHGYFPQPEKIDQLVVPIEAWNEEDWTLHQQGQQ